MKNENLLIRKTWKVSQGFILAACLLFVSYPSIAGFPNPLSVDSVPKTNSLSLYAGLSTYREIERTASPLKYSSLLVPVMFGYNHISSKNIWNTSMEMAIGNAWASDFKLRSVQVNSFDEDGNPISSVVNLEKMSASYLIIQGEYLLRTRYILDGRFAWYNGVKIQEYLFGQGTIISVFMNQLTLNPKTSIFYSVNNKITLATSMSFTIFALNTRLNYSRDPYTPEEEYLKALFSETGFNTLNKFQRADFSVSVQTKLTKRWLISFDYLFYWFHHCQFQGIKLYENKLQITFSRNFTSKKNEK